MIQHNPALQNNPNAREMIDVIRSGDANPKTVAVCAAAVTARSQSTTSAR